MTITNQKEKDMKKVVLTRKQYKDIKRYDHNDMNVFMASMYASGYADGKNDAPNGPGIEEIRNAIASTKGIGESKLSAIMENIGRLYQE